jgi:hypothetical protein
MRILSNISNTDAISGTYPNGRIRNKNTVSSPPVVGTPIVEEIYGDIVLYFQKLVSFVGITFNDLPDNETNGYQTLNSIFKLAHKVSKRYSRTISLNNENAYSVNVNPVPVGISMNVLAIDLSDTAHHSGVVNYTLNDDTSSAMFNLSMTLSGTAPGDNTLHIKSSAGKTIVSFVRLAMGADINKKFILLKTDLDNDNWFYLETTNIY